MKRLIAALFVVGHMFACGQAEIKGTVKVDRSIINQTDESSQKQGYWEETDPNTKLKEAGAYIDGTKDGAWEYFHSSGVPTKIEHYAEGQLNGALISLTKRGYLRTMYHYTDGVKDGVQYEYHDGARVKKEESYTNGQLEGKYLVYYRTGKKQEEANYVNGQKDGVAKWYFDGNENKV
ncbi:MAG: antitoxin component YwqK of YwqJK toxin-antitoxin module, partial [Flavobacteriales bacterium]